MRRISIATQTVSRKLSREELKSTVLGLMSEKAFKKADGSVFESAQTYSRVQEGLRDLGVSGLGNSGEFISQIEAAGFGFYQDARPVSGNRKVQVFYVKQ